MSDLEATYSVGETFQIQYVWSLPDADWLRALFEVEVLALDPQMARYAVRLARFVAGRQEAPDGSMREGDALARQSWAKIIGFVGSEVHVPFEADDNRPIRLRYTTLSGEHAHFKRSKQKNK